MSIKDDIMRAEPFFACPYCNSKLKKYPDKLLCETCDQTYIFDETGRPDLRLKKPKVVNTDIRLAPECFRETDYSRMPRRLNHVVEGIGRISKTARYYYSSIPIPESEDVVCLDIGCGSVEIKRPFIERAGYKYIGFDCDSQAAPIIGDAHAIPFASNCFDLATGHAVMEHFRQPWIVVDEVFRILKPGGYYHGWVAFIEGFHDSYFHMTHWAIGSLLKSAGFKVEWLEPDINNLWFIMHDMFPRIPGSFFRVICTPVYLLHRLWYIIGSRFIKRKSTSEDIRRWKVPGGIMFLARKPELVDG